MNRLVVTKKSSLSHVLGGNKGGGLIESKEEKHFRAAFCFSLNGTARFQKCKQLFEP
jgi:hypothetical protein